jgi:aminoglycoside phosphotransferase (APT) family kinase protein
VSRPQWSTAPQQVQAWAAAVLGSPVVEARSEPGGWSPGVAARVRCADGRRAFVKAASAQVNAETAQFHRREAYVAARLPAGIGSPRLLASYDEQGWVALLFDEVDGRPPVAPWVPAELNAALALLDRIAAEASVPALEPVGSAHRFDGWSRLAAEGTALTPWEARHLDRLVGLEQTWPAAAAGPALLHGDVRADNLLLRPDGSAVLVDWPAAALGSATVDLVFFAPSVALAGGPPPHELLRRTAVSRAAEPDAVTVQVVAFAGYLQHRRRQPPPPGIPTVRAFQAAQGDVALGWLAERTGWH